MSSSDPQKKEMSEAELSEPVSYYIKARFFAAFCRAKSYLSPGRDLACGSMGHGLGIWNVRMPGG